MAKTPDRKGPKDSKDSAKPAPALVPEPAEKESPIDARLNIPLDKDGKPLLGNMRETSREKLRELLPELQRAIGGTSAATSGAMALPPELMYPLVHGLSIMGVLVVGKLTKAPREMVERLVPFTPDESKAVAPALAAVLNKYGGSMLTKYQEEAALLGLVVALGMQKVSAVREEMDRAKPRLTIVPIAGDVPREPPAEPGDVN